MDFPLFLAMTAAEFASCSHLPPKIAYMSCHFSPYSTALSGIPEHLPAGSVLMVTDRTPPCEHDPEQIAAQLSEAAVRLSCSWVLLDLQRPDLPENAAIAKAVVSTLSCPVAISEHYAAPLDCGVLLSPPPLWTPLQNHLAPWQGRSIWLEAAAECACVTVTEAGSEYACCSCEPPEKSFCDRKLHIDYRISLSEKGAAFHLSRTRQHLSELLQEAQALQVHAAIGLYQQLGQR